MSQKKSDLYIIVVGCGRLGTYLANSLSRDGYSVVVIDKDEKALSNLAEDFGGFRIEADAVEIQTLIKANIERADVVVTTTNDDNTNILIAQVAKTIYKVEKVVARLYDLNRQRVYEQLDIITVNPTLLSARRFEEIITGEEQGAI